MFEGKVDVIPGKNPHHANVRIEKEIEEGAEKGQQAEQELQDNEKRQKQDSGKSPEGEGRQIHENLENQSPNPNSGATAHDRGSENSTGFSPLFQNVATHGIGRGGHMPLPTSAPTSSLQQVLDASKQVQKGQQSAPTLQQQAASYTPSHGAPGNAGATQGRGHDPRRNFLPLTKPHTPQMSQQNPCTQPLGPVSANVMTADGFF